MLRRLSGSAKKLVKAHTSMAETNTKGEFVRTDSVFRDWVKADKSGKYPAEANRYHLYVSYACPWASRCLMLRSMKGLEDVISLSVVGAVFQKTSKKDDHHGWVFNDEPGAIADDIMGAKTVRELYEKCNDTLGKYTVPILFDKKTKMIVNNESSEIIQMFNSEFNEFAKNPSLNLYPEKHLKDMEAVDAWIYPTINNGVYRSGFAVSQEAYDIAVNEVFEGLDKVEEILSKQRYIASPDMFTASDVRLFVTLVRFDEVYHGHFKCNKKRIADYPNIENYVRDIFQMEGVESTVNMDHIKRHYHMSHPTINKYAIVPVGPGVDYSLPHNRDRKY